jgi:hypothetical protein
MTELVAEVTLHNLASKSPWRADLYEVYQEPMWDGENYFTIAHRQDCIATVFGRSAEDVRAMLWGFADATKSAETGE